MAGALTEHLRDWRPGTTELVRRVEPWPAEVFAGLLGTPPPPLGTGDPLPPLWHWFTLLDPVPQHALGRDGHPTDGPFSPPIPDRRRMFAGGRMRQDSPVPVGAELTSRSRVAAVTVKAGRNGELAFVTVRHELSVDGARVGTEEQDLVYRSEPDGAEPASVPTAGGPPPDADAGCSGPWRADLATDPVLLFRFSALTHNAHRIHYDRPYATEVERYPDLVVHGPLLALLALELPRRYAPDRTVRAYAYRLVRPAFAPSLVVADGGPAEHGADVTVAARGSAPSLTAAIDLDRSEGSL